MTRRPLIIAHRGAHQDHAENSLAALEAARRMGCDGAEFDVRTSHDGTPILFHDSRLGGRRGRPLARLNVDELPTHVPTLAHVWRWRDLHPAFMVLAEAKTVEAARAMVRTLPTHIEHSLAISFLGDAIRSWHEDRPRWQLGWLRDHARPADATAARRLGAGHLVVRARAASRKLLDAGTSEEVHVWTWGNRSSRRVAQLARQGVTGAIVDRPNRFLARGGRTPNL